MVAEAKTRVLELEKQFGEAMKRKYGAAASRMSAEDCVIVGAQGVSAVDRKTMAKLTVEGQWSIEHYEFDDKSVQVRMIGDDVALIAYKVTERLRVGGEPITLEANDASVWRRQDGEWTCLMHTESPAGDPFGRDRKDRP